jgi:hypothetical protein
MAGIGLNPRYGWDPRPNYPQGDVFGFGYAWPPPAYDGFLPPPPPGFAWFDVGGAAPIPLPAMPCGMPGAAPMPPQWDLFGQFGQDWGPGFNGAARDGAFPGASFRNAQGGVGMEPGYGYLFPPNHCKIHVLNSPSPPWLHAGPYDKKSFNVPTGITVKELMQQFGCTNKDPARNKLVELTQGGDGTWYKGVELVGDNEKQMNKRIEEVGWNANRNGVDADFVWLYFTRE